MVVIVILFVSYEGRRNDDAVQELTLVRSEV
jgi:hypothetical protein